MKTVKGRKTADRGAVKRAVSLPRALDHVVLAVSRENGRTYSSIVRDALDLYIGRLKDAELEKAYRAYYSGEDARAVDRSLAEELFSLSKAGWPE